MPGLRLAYCRQVLHRDFRLVVDPEIQLAVAKSQRFGTISGTVNVCRTIHCFWAGGAKTKLAERCLASWRKFAPDWKICEWNLSNIPDESMLPSFCVEAVRRCKWAMVSDWVRMWVLKEHGGLYLDFDVELVRPLDELPDGEWVAGEWTAKNDIWMNPGGGIALVPGSALSTEMLDRYERLKFDPQMEMMAWINENLKDIGGLKVLDPEVMSPIDIEGRLRRTERTVGIHWYAMSWASPQRKLARWLSWHGMRWVVDGLLKVRDGR